MAAYPVIALLNDLLGLVPVSILHCVLQVRPMMPVKILKYPVLILKTPELRLLRWRYICRRGQSSYMLFARDDLRTRCCGPGDSRD